MMLAYSFQPSYLTALVFGSGLYVLCEQRTIHESTRM